MLRALLLALPAAALDVRLRPELTQAQLAELSVVVTVTNDKDTSRDFETTRTPFEGGVYADEFEVTDRAGARMAYIGKLARRVPGVTSHVTLQPGASLAASVPLWDSYAFTHDGDYAVAYGGASCNVTVQGTAGFGAKLAALRVGASYEGCTNSEQSSISSAESQAGREVTSARSSLSRGHTNHYEEWFGASSSSRHTTVTSCFTAVNSQLGPSNTRYNCNQCRNDRNVYAYVYPSDSSMTQYLCGAFWSQANERANTIVHEVTHFNRVCGTNDYGYGKSFCRNLARTNPGNAVRNADNYCYFSETA